MQNREKWSAPGTSLALAPDEVHLWRVSLDASCECLHAFAQTLSADERARADRYRFEVHRRRFVVGRGALRALLGRYCGQAPAEIRFAYGPWGKPSLAGPPVSAPIYFSASGSEDCALYAFTLVGEIGVDVERVRAIPEWQDIAGRVLARAHHTAPPATLTDFFRAWTQHEAHVKALGIGLGAALPAEQSRVLQSLAIEEDLIASVALPTGARPAECWRWGDQLAVT